MNIGIDASRAFSKEKTGTENYSYQLIKALAKIDRENNYSLYTRNSQFSIDFRLPKNFKLKVISWPRLWTQGGLVLECLVNPPDVLFIPAHTLPILRRRELKTVVTIHDLGAEFLPEHHQFPNKLYLNKSTEYAVRHATRLIAVSESTKRDLIIKLHCDAEKVGVIYEGYDSEKFRIPAKGEARRRRQNSEFRIMELRKKYRVVGNYILFVGTVQPRKNLVRLIEAFARALSSGYKASSKGVNDLDLLIIGKPGWMYEEIYKAPKKFGVEGKVKFLNYVSDEDLPLFYQGALCAALPSLYEGFGLPVLEAMACGCPVVVSKTSSLSEVAGEAGFLVDPYNAEDIKNGLIKVINEAGIRSRLIRKGLEQVKKFSWEKCAEETLKVLKEAGGKS